MRALEKVGVGLLLVVGALVLAGDYLHQPRLFSAALFAFGIAGCLGAVARIMRREVQGGFWSANYRERMTDVAAVLLGLLLLVGGAVIALLGVIDLVRPGGAAGFLTALVSTPRGLGIVLGLAGLLLAMFGAVRVMSGSAKASGSLAPHAELSFRVAGAVAVLLGVIMAVVALALILQPDLVGGAFDTAKGKARGILGR